MNYEQTRPKTWPNGKRKTEENIKLREASKVETPRKSQKVPLADYSLYGLTEHGIIKYVGITHNLKARLNGHIRPAHQRNTKKDRWIRGVILSGGQIEMKILRRSLTLNRAIILERQVIRKLRPQLFNSSGGGEYGFRGGRCWVQKQRAISEHGRRMANRRWQLDRERREQLAKLTAEQYPTRIIRRIIVIDDERVVREAVIWSFDYAKDAKRKTRQVLQYG